MGGFCRTDLAPECRPGLRGHRPGYLLSGSQTDRKGPHAEDTCHPARPSRDALRGHGRDHAHRSRPEDRRHRGLRARARRQVAQQGCRRVGRRRLLQFSIEQADDRRRGRRFCHEQPGILRARPVLRELRPCQHHRQLPAPSDRVQLPDHGVSGSHPGSPVRTPAAAVQDAPRPT